MRLCRYMFSRWQEDRKFYCFMLSALINANADISIKVYKIHGKYAENTTDGYGAEIESDERCRQLKSGCSVGICRLTRPAAIESKHERHWARRENYALSAFSSIIPDKFNLGDRILAFSSSLA